uniref:Uncharacterized protein n=1 Tax=Cacopsylla melanoneura TaxID=428564 RepID=A0A8D8Z1T6_9HEMI
MFFDTRSNLSILYLCSYTRIYLLYKLTLSSIKYDNNWTINRNTYHTRQHGQTVVKRVNKTITQRHFYLGEKLYNKIPTELKNLKLPLLLKMRTKEFVKKKQQI